MKKNGMKLVAKIANDVARRSVGVTCIVNWYQPKVPMQLKTQK